MCGGNGKALSCGCADVRKRELAKILEEAVRQFIRSMLDLHGVVEDGGVGGE